MTLKSDAKFVEKLTCCLENDIRNLANFHQSTWECLWWKKLWWGPFVQSKKCMRLKFTVGLCIMTMKNDRKMLKELTCRFKIDMRNLTNFDLSTRKSKKCIVLIGTLWPKYILLELQKYRGVICHDTEEFCKFWRKTDLWFEKRH